MCCTARCAGGVVQKCELVVVCGSAWEADLASALPWDSEAGSRPAATYFSCSRNQSKQKKRAPTARVPSHSKGQPRCSIAGWCRRTRCAAMPLRSNNCGKSDHEADVSCGTSAHPALCAPRHGQKGRPNSCLSSDTRLYKTSFSNKININRSSTGGMLE